MNWKRLIIYNFICWCEDFKESGNIYELTCNRECENEKCRMSVGDNECQELECIKEYFYKRAGEENDAIGK